MAKITLFIKLFSLSIFIIDSINGQESTTATSSPDPSSPNEMIDAYADGEQGNPGALIRYTPKALDAIYAHSIEKIAEQIKAMVIPDVIVPVGGGMLTIKQAKISEVKIPDYERQLIPPNRLKTRFYNGKIVSVGQWQYKPFQGARTMAQGIFRVIVNNAELNVTNQFGRTWDAKPKIDTQECKAFLGNFKVVIEGFGDNATTIDQCENLLCQRIRAYFEEMVCNTARSYIKETINQKLATFPTRINLGSSDRRFVLDYGLLKDEPKVTDQFIQAGLEGDILSRGTGSVPFYAPDMQPMIDMKKMVSFPLSDYVFNTLFYHAHNQQYRFSAFDLIPSTSQIKNLLKMNCQPATPAPGSVGARYAARKTLRQGQSPNQSQVQEAIGKCLGSMFGNSTFDADAMGDLVFKSQRALQVIVRRAAQESPIAQPGSTPSSSVRHINIAGSLGGSIELFGPMGPENRRELLGRVDVQKLEGEFFPRMNLCNVTGKVTLTELQLAQPAAPGQSRSRSLSDPQLQQLNQFAQPILTELLNGFLEQFAQFPIPMLDGYECTSPEFHQLPRTMQVNCDVRVLPTATRKTKG